MAEITSAEMQVVWKTIDNMLSRLHALEKKHPDKEPYEECVVEVLEYLKFPIHSAFGIGITEIIKKHFEKWE